MGPGLGWGPGWSQARPGKGTVSAVGQSEARHCSLSAGLTSHFAFFQSSQWHKDVNALRNLFKVKVQL